METHSASYNHCIGGIRYLTITDVDFPDLHQGGITKYLTNREEPDIINNIRKIDINTLILPAFTPDERNRIEECLVISDIADESQILTPYVIKGKDKKLYSLTRGINDNLDAPLFRSSAVRERLNACLEHSDQIVLITHVLFIEIRDFYSHQVDLFYVDELTEAIEKFSTRKYIERMFRIFLPDFHATLVHSSSVNRKGKAVLFLAQSGGGKTTIARQAPIESVLSDDQAFLRFKDGKNWVYSTPWGMIVNSPEAIPLGGFFLIEKSKQFELVPLKPRRVLSFLWNEHLHYFSMMPKTTRTNVFNLLSQAVSSVPLYSLHTPLDGMDWDKIDACL